MTNLTENNPLWGIVLAAGFGKRLKPLTDVLPKPLITVRGVTLLDHAIQNLIDVGITNIVVNGHYKAGMIKEHLDQKWNLPNITIHFVYEEEILETGGGIMNIMRLFNIERALVSNSDILLIDKTQPALTPLINAPHATELILMVQHHSISPQGIEYGDFIIAENDHFIFDPQKRGPYFFLGSYIIDQTIFSDRAEVSKFSMLEYIAKSSSDAYKNTPYFVAHYDGIFLDIGTLSLLSKAENLILSA